MINDTILAIKDSILSTVGESCEKIYLFGSYAYGTPHKDSDYDFFVVLKKHRGMLYFQTFYHIEYTFALKPVNHVFVAVLFPEIASMLS
jgi:predicted nucleotidyltransferase